MAPSGFIEDCFDITVHRFRVILGKGSEVQVSRFKGSGFTVQG
jgi:hypothetical protein